MIFCVICLTCCASPLLSLGNKKEITVSEKRPDSIRDGSPELFASSDERFRDAKPSPAKGETPPGWLALPTTQMRLLNYRFGNTGNGEVWVSISKGSLLDNVNRWLTQFGSPAVDQAALEKMPTMTLAGSPGSFVSAEADYEGGIGAPSKLGSAFAGVVASIKGEIVTVKMVAPKDDVTAAKPALENFIQSLRLAE